VLGIQDAEHEETAPTASQLVVNKLVCSLAGRTEALTIMPGTRLYQVYGRTDATEKFACNYGLNPAYREKISQAGLKIAGVDSAGDVTAVELSAQRFFIATLFLPQLSSSPDNPHPFIVAYLKAAREFQAFRQSSKTRI
jgi:CTP synthase (UTP-ammonia lyase)